MKQFVILLLVIALVLQVPVALASNVEKELSEEELHTVVEDYLARYAHVVYEFGDDDFSQGTIADFSISEMSNLAKSSITLDTYSAAKDNSEYIQLKAEYFKNFRLKNNIFRENCWYEYEYHDIHLNDNSATVSVSEYAHFNYANDPIESILESVFEIQLFIVDGTWTIAEVKEVNWFDATYSELTPAATERAFNELLQFDNTSPVVNVIDPEVELTATNYKIFYDQTNASAYAMTYTTSSSSSTSFYNKNFSDWTSYGDCQNFASQCVWAGFYGSNSTNSITAHDIPMDNEGTNIWYGDSTQWKETPSWRGCDNFRQYIENSTTSTDVGIYGNVYNIAANSGVTSVSSYLRLVGAVIQVDGYLDNVLTPYNHSVVVDSATGLSRNEIYCCGHTQMAKHVKLSEINNSCAAKLIIPSYFRTDEPTGNILKGRYMNPIPTGTTTTVKCFTDNLQYKMTIQVYAPSGLYTSKTDYSCDELAFSHTFSETGLYRITAYAKPTSENDTATAYQYYVRVY